MTTGTTVAVTGASGFIGRALVRALVDAGHQVRVLTRQTPTSPDVPGVSTIVGSLADVSALERLLEGADIVVHGAGATKALARGYFFEVNVEGTARLAALAAARSVPPRFIYISSIAARAPHLSPYAASKRAAEDAIAASASRLPTAIVRPPAVYGPGDHEILRFLKMATRGFLLAPAIDDARLSLVHVEDVARLILAVIAVPHPIPSPLEFDDGTPSGYTWAMVADAAGKALRRPVRLVPAPGLAVRAFAAAASARAHLMRRPSVLSWGKVPELLHPDWVASGPAFAGYVPRWSLESGLRNTAEWAESQGLLRLLR